MSSVIKMDSSTAYRNYSEIEFCVNNQGALSVIINTERIQLRSVTEKDCKDYAELFGDSAVMGKYATGQPKTAEETEKRVKDTWIKRFESNDPYNALAVFEIDSGAFLGHVVLGHGDEPGQSELAYLFKQNHWGKRFGTEAVTAVVKEYAPATVKKGYKLDGKTLEVITATARPDNQASVKILEKLGMKKTSEEEKYGALRYNYEIQLADIAKKV